jgi:hypothetical protein
MTTEEILNGILEDATIEEHNIRICYIKRIVEQRKFIGADTSVAKMDDICDMNNKQLEEYDQHLHELCSQLKDYTHE